MISFFTEFLAYIKERRKFILVPIFTAMILVGGLIMVTQGSTIAPFIYTLF